jgi:Protein of unknown function (DUF4100)
MTPEVIMVKALDTCVTEEEEEEIGLVFASTHDIKETSKDEGDEYRVCNTAIMEGYSQETKLNSGHYTNLHWARSTTEALVRLNNLKEHVRALVDHGSEINIMARSVYEKGKWPIDVGHGWMLKGANNGKGELYAACPGVNTKIGDVEVEQNFFVQNVSSYPIILGQPYITAIRMETKVLDNGSHYARIRSLDGKRSVQFNTVVVDHDRNRDQLRDIPIQITNDFQDF